MYPIFFIDFSFVLLVAASVVSVSIAIWPTKKKKFSEISLEPKTKTKSKRRKKKEIFLWDVGGIASAAVRFERSARLMLLLFFRSLRTKLLPSYNNNDNYIAVYRVVVHGARVYYTASNIFLLYRFMLQKYFKNRNQKMTTSKTTETTQWNMVQSETTPERSFCVSVCNWIAVCCG